MTQYVEVPSQRIPVSHDADVVVAGGGTAGVAAAVTAARLGLSVVMIESSALPGGMASQINQWLGDFEGKGGFAREFLDRLRAMGAIKGTDYNPFFVVPCFDALLQEAGVRALYLAAATAPILEGGAVRGVIMESKSGRTAVRARYVVDATGDGDIAARAGADFKVGRDSDGACQAISLTHLLMNYTGPAMDKPTFARLLEAAARRAGFPWPLPYDHWRIRPMAGTERALSHTLPHVTGKSALSADELSDALIALRRQAWDLYRLLKDHAPEFRGIEFGPFPALPGVRESRRLVCDAVITLGDAMSGRAFPDGLFRVNQGIDIHRCNETDPQIVLRKVAPYQIPYRALLPKGVEGVIVAGRCIGGEHESLAGYRVMGDCMAMGEAAALAVKFACGAGASLRSVPAADLAAEMRRRGYAS